MLLIVVIAVVAILAILNTRSQDGGADEVWPFYAKKPLSQPEQVLYFRLVQALPEHIILAQVQTLPLAQGQERLRLCQAWFNRINFKRAQLSYAGWESLADRIEQVSVTEGLAAGFGIRSFKENSANRFIETKTTKYGKNTPFFVIPNELRFSQENTKRYFLYRVFRFRTEPRVFTLYGHLQDRCILKPSQFLATPA